IAQSSINYQSNYPITRLPDYYPIPLELDDHDRRHRIENRPLDVEEGTAVLGRHLDRRAVGQAVGARGPVAHARQREGDPRLVEEREIELAWLGRHAPLRLLIDERVAADVLRAAGARLAELLAERRRLRAVDR